MLKRLILIAATVAAAILFAHAASAAPPGSSHVDGSGSTIWGVWDEGSESFSLNVFTTPQGLGGHISWRGAKATDSLDGPLVPYRYAGPPSCLAVSGDVAVVGVVHYYPGQVYAYQGVLVIVQNDGSVEHAWAVLLEAESLASARSECDGLLGELGDFGPLPVLNGQVTIS
jgi:hypothetical protein